MNNSVYLYNDADCDLLLGHDDGVYCLAVVSNGTEILSGSFDQTIRRWSVHTGQCLQVYRGCSDAVFCVAELRNGNLISGSNKSIKVWNRVTGMLLTLPMFVAKLFLKHIILPVYIVLPMCLILMI